MQNRNKKVTKLIPKLFYIHPMAHQRIIDHFIEAKGFTSEGEVIRHCLTFAHDKEFPDYVYRESAAGEIKKKRIEEEDKLRDISDEEYVINILKARIFDSSVTDKKFVTVHNIGNSVEVYPLEGIKEFMEYHEDLRDFHLNTLKVKSLDDAFSTYTKGLLRSSYKLVIND